MTIEILAEIEFIVYDTWNLKIVHKGNKEQCEHYVKR
jgi:hypothetical protein